METSSNPPRRPDRAQDRASDQRFGRWFDGARSESKPQPGESPDDFEARLECARRHAIREELRIPIAQARRAQHRAGVLLLFAVALYLITLAALALGLGRLLWA